MTTASSVARRKRKVAVTRWPSGDVHFQMGGRDIPMKDLRESVLADMESRATSSMKVDALDVYVKPEDGRAYYTADGPTGGMSGSVAL